MMRALLVQTVANGNLTWRERLLLRVLHEVRAWQDLRCAHGDVKDLDFQHPSLMQKLESFSSYMNKCNHKEAAHRESSTPHNSVPPPPPSLPNTATKKGTHDGSQPLVQVRGSEIRCVGFGKLGSGFLDFRA